MGNEQTTVVWGGGAIGGVVTAQLAKAGHDVLLVDVVADHVQAVRERGLEIVDADGAVTLTPMRAALPEEVAGVYPRILLAVKGQHTRAAATALLPHLAPDGWVLALQNGLTELTLAEVVGKMRTLGALVNFASDYLGPGRIQFGGKGSLQVGELDGSDTPRSREAAALMQSVEPEAAWTGQLLSFKWSKVAIGSLLFGTALTNDTIAEQIADPARAALWREICVEVVEVARAVGVEPACFDGFDPAAFTRQVPMARSAAQLQEIAEHCRHWVGKPRSGIWRDLAVRKRKTEADPQLTDILACGRRVGIATPTVQRLLALIQEMEDGTRDFDRANLDALAAQ